MAKDDKKTTEKKTRVRRSREEIKKDLEAKIAFHKEQVAKLEDRIKKLDEPRKPSGRKSEKTLLIEQLLSEGKIDKKEAKKLGLKIKE